MFLLIYITKYIKTEDGHSFIDRWTLLGIVFLHKLRTRIVFLDGTIVWLAHLPSSPFSSQVTALQDLRYFYTIQPTNWLDIISIRRSRHLLAPTDRSV